MPYERQVASFALKASLMRRCAEEECPLSSFCLGAKGERAWLYGEIRELLRAADTPGRVVC